MMGKVGEAISLPQPPISHDNKMREDDILPYLSHNNKSPERIPFGRFIVQFVIKITCRL